jgi:hypothetical protein
MDGEQHPRHVGLRHARDSTLVHLSDAFARDEISLDDFERRVGHAYACREEGELLPLLADLVPPSASALTRAAATTQLETVPAASGPPPPARLALAVFGHVERRIGGTFTRGARVLAVFGNVELDLRDLKLPPGVTELHVRAVFGNVEITVPATLTVECRGTPVFGSFASLERLPAVPAGEAVLRVIGSAVFGNVEVRTLPAQSSLTSHAARLLRGPE